MPTGEGAGARQPPPKRETFRPPWVKGGEDNGEITKPSSITGGKQWHNIGTATSKTKAALPSEMISACTSTSQRASDSGSSAGIDVNVHCKCPRNIKRIGKTRTHSVGSSTTAVHVTTLPLETKGTSAPSLTNTVKDVGFSPGDACALKLMHSKSKGTQSGHFGDDDISKTIVRPKTNDAGAKETTNKSTNISKANDPAPSKGDSKSNTNSNSKTTKTANADEDKPKGMLRKQTTVKESGENGVQENKPASKARQTAKEPDPVQAPSPLRSASRDMKEGLPPKRPPVPRQPSKDEDGARKKWRDPLRERVKENIDRTLANDTPEGHTLTKNQSLRSLLKPAPPPMPPPMMPPKAPPPPEFKRDPLSVDKLKKLESLKSRPRRRPDWSDMMKEVESGKKLNHVVCNDRSSPIITTASVIKAKDKFVFESEKEPAHNDLLKQIEKGIRLKKTRTNDRSKPNLDGLRKFRRQMTIEEQIQKSQSQANLAEVKETPPEEDEIDEMDDIDKVRDDLQSTKQLLALELRNKEAQSRENKLLQKRIENLEAELAKERAIIKQSQAKTVISVTDAYDDKLVTSLKDEVSKTKNVAVDLEKMYHQTAEELDETKSALEEAQRKNAELEKRLQQALSNIFGTKGQEDEPESFYVKRQKEFAKQCLLLGVVCPTNNIPSTNESCNMQDYSDDDDQGHFPQSNQSSRRSSHAIRQLSVKESSFEEEESEEEEEGEETEEKKQKKIEKEVKVMKAKLKQLIDKRDKAKKEREGLKVQLKNQQEALKQERKKYKELKREVDKMAAMMKDVGDGEDDDDEDDDEEEEEDNKKLEIPETSEEEDTETEQETESETESESEPEDSPPIKKRENLTPRVKKYESALNALKKGNALLLANVDRLKDDVNKQKEESSTMQADLDSLLAELE